MRLEGEQSAEQSSAAKHASVRLTDDELSSLLNDAIARQSQATQPAQTASLAEALDIARQLNIPEEHVLAAAKEVQKRRLRELRRGVARDRRKGPFLGAAGLAMGVAVVALLSGFSVGAIAALLVVGLPAAFLGWRWKAAPVTDAEADATELPPQPGRCRVCWAEATNSRSTFCAEHQYQPPS